MSYQEYLEEQAEQEKVRQIEIDNFRSANGFSDEEDELISWKFGVNVRD